VRKILITLAMLVLTVGAILGTWIFLGRQVSLWIDRFGTIQIASVPIHSVAYEGNGTGGWLTVNDVRLSLVESRTDIALSIGSTKDNQFALASAEKVFAFGPLMSTAENTGDHLAAVVAVGDQAFLATRHSVLSWPTPFDFNFMTGWSPSWKRHIYYEIRWKKSSGANLQMLWH
jgi:hypothetical protein